MKLTLRVPRPAPMFMWLMLTFLVLFPKGGIKLANVPFTWGYALIGLSIVPLLLTRLLVSPMRQSLPGLVAAATLLPFQLTFAYAYFSFGHDNLAYFLSLVTSFFVLPTLFLLIYPSFLHLGDTKGFSRHFCFCVLAAALWGIFLFFYHPLTGKLIEIPLLTVNAGDYGQLETLKHIDRGGYLKLISTYNNGNVYGVATLILFPLFLKLEPRLWKRNVVRIALVLTLSRTVWIGLLVEQGLSVASQLPDLMTYFPKIRPGKAANQALALIGTAGLVLFGTLFFQVSAASLLLDRDLGGRAGELSNFGNATLLPVVAVSPFAEVLYASALATYGVAGFIGIVLIFAAPVLFFLAMPSIRRSPVQRAAAKGLVIYAIVAVADGATVWIPVMAFYWFAYMTMLYGLPGRRPGTTTRPESLASTQWSAAECSPV